MSDLDHPEYSPSKTPRVDRAERLIYSDEKEPIKYVLATFAKHLEMELNQALADLKAARLKWTPDLRQQFKWDTVTRNGVNHDRDKKAQRTPAGAQSQGRA